MNDIILPKPAEPVPTGSANPLKGPIMQTMIIIGDAMHPDSLNMQIEKKTAGLDIVDVKTTSHSSRWRHKSDYVIVTILYKK